jgi:NitT/TauT family transport system ATP-binding protein
VTQLRINIKNLNKKFDDETVLHDFSMQANAGDIIGLKGSSGSGKTTLLRIISSLDTDFSAETFDIKGKISYLFQENRLFDFKDVFSNISFVVDEVLQEDEKNEQIDDLLKRSYLYEDKHKYPNALSGGMQRRVALCRSFIYPCDILIMDEPFSGLDLAMKHKIADNFLALASKDLLIVIVTHDEAILEKCDRIITLKEKTDE